MVKKIARYSTNTQAIKSATLASRITHHYVTNSNTYYNYNRILLSPKSVLVEAQNLGMLLQLNYIIIISHFMGTRLAPCAVKEVEILRQERVKRPIMMMVFLE
jgi:hypothetical protein